MELMDIVAELKNASVQMPEEKIDQFIEAVEMCIRDRPDTSWKFFIIFKDVLRAVSCKQIHDCLLYTSRCV